MPDTPRQEIKLFYCYAREDKDLRDKFERSLSGLKRYYRLGNWYDREILAGQEWEKAIAEQLNSADIIFLLISNDFMASDYCYGIEMQRALERHAEGSCLVIPILLRPTHWEGEPFGKLQLLPTDARPITRWPDRDDAFQDVVREVSRAIKEIIKHQEEREIRRIERKIRIFGYETGGKQSVLWNNPFGFSFDGSFNEWNNAKRKFQEEEIVGNTWLKVSDWGDYWVVRFFKGGHLTEEFLSNPSRLSDLSESDPGKRWTGSWELIEGESILRVNIGKYEIDVLATNESPTYSGIEFEKDQKEPRAYHVFFQYHKAKAISWGLRDASSLVDQICKQVLSLDRETKSEDFILFGSLLHRGERSIREVVKLLGLSPDYRERYVEERSTDEVIELFYKHFLDRKADDDGKQHYINKVKKTGFDAIIVELIDSPEYMRDFGENIVPTRYWLETNVNTIRIGLVSPKPMATVFQSSILAKGLIEGLPTNDEYLIVGYVITDIEYEQEAALIDRDGSWLIYGIKLSATSHRLFFRIFDMNGEQIAESKEIIVLKG